MSTVHVEAELSTESLVAALEKLPPRELDDLLNRVLAIRVRHAPLSLTPSETQLLESVNRAISREERSEYDTLLEELEAGALSPEGQVRLTALAGRLEELQADRIRAVADMAASRNVPFRELWLQLGLGQEPHA